MSEAQRNEFPLDRRVGRLTPLQRALLAYMAERGGTHVYLSQCTRALGPLRGYTWEGVHLSLQSLLRAGLIEKSGRIDGLWSLTPNEKVNGDER